MKYGHKTELRLKLSKLITELADSGLTEAQEDILCDITQSAIALQCEIAEKLSDALSANDKLLEQNKALVTELNKRALADVRVTGLMN